MCAPVLLKLGGHHNPSSDVSSTGACLGILNLPAADLRVLISMKLEGSWEEIPRGDPGHSSAQHESLLLEHSQGFASETAAGHICNQLQKQLYRFSDLVCLVLETALFHWQLLSAFRVLLCACMRPISQPVLEVRGFWSPEREWDLVVPLLLAPHMICLYGTTLVLAFGLLKSDQL